MSQPSDKSQGPKAQKGGKRGVVGGHYTIKIRSFFLLKAIHNRLARSFLTTVTRSARAAPAPAAVATAAAASGPRGSIDA